MILLPGWGASAFAFRHQLPALSGAGYRAVAVDLKGHGFSDKPTAAGEYTFEAMLRHVEDVVAAIARAPVALVALSMAAPLAVGIARRTPDLVSRMVLISPVGLGVIPFIGLARLVAGRWLDPIAPRLATRSVVRVAVRVARGDGEEVSEDEIDEYWAPSQFPGFARALRALVHDFSWSPLPDREWTAVANRTLVLLGTRDRLSRGSIRRAARLFGPRAIVIPAGHVVNEVRPELVNAAIIDFLKGS